VGYLAGDNPSDGLIRFLGLFGPVGIGLKAENGFVLLDGINWNGGQKNRPPDFSSGRLLARVSFGAALLVF
jgi:hypothetical protein